MNDYVSLRKGTFYFLLGSTLVFVALLVNVARQVVAKESSSTDNYEYLKAFTDVLSLVERNYVQPVDNKALVEGAIKGMVVTLDPHSSYLTPDNYKDLQVETKGEFGGLGIEITVKNGLLTVVSPIEDSPAAIAGVQPGDQIIKIGDEFTKQLSLVDAVKKMRGPKGSPITISVHRDGSKELVPLTIIRDIIKVKSVRSRLLEDGFGYVRLAQFQEGSADEFAAALKELDRKVKGGKLRGLVLDLRNDPGGLLTQAIRVADIFLKEDVIVYTDGRLESQKQKYYAHNDGNEPDYPIVVIVNGGSASASEIVAGALQDSRRGLILGTQSFGKGSVQTILPMDNGAALRLTTALYYTKSGRSIQAQGVTPDVVVPDRRFPKDSEELLEEDESDGEDLGPAKERDLPGALKNPGTTEQSTAPGPSNGNNRRVKKDRVRPGEEPSPIGSRAALEMELPKLLKEDPQLDQALKLLKTLNIFQGSGADAAKTAANLNSYGAHS